jgi:hypothetical protein
MTMQMEMRGSSPSMGALALDFEHATQRFPLVSDFA